MATAKKPDEDGLVSQDAAETPEEVNAYWTPERTRSAKPVPLPALPAEAAESATPKKPTEG